MPRDSSPAKIVEQGGIDEHQGKSDERSQEDAQGHCSAQQEHNPDQQQEADSQGINEDQERRDKGAKEALLDHLLAVYRCTEHNDDGLQAQHIELALPSGMIKHEAGGEQEIGDGDKGRDEIGKAQSAEQPRRLQSVAE